MRIELYTEEIPSIFDRFQDLVGESHWRKRVVKINNEIRGNRFLHDYLVNENEIAFGLDLCSDLKWRHGQIPIHTVDCRPIYPSIAFAAQVLSIIDKSSPKQTQQLGRRIHGALKNPDDMRALQLELVAATHFIKRGHFVAWPEMNGTATMDLVIDDLGPSGLEVECKSISEDKGRKISMREVIDFWHLLAPELNSVGNHLRIGLAVVLTVEKRLPTAFNDRKQMVRAVLENLLTGNSVTMLPGGGNLRVFEFDLRLLGEIGSKGIPVITRTAVDQITETNNREAMVVGRKSGGAVVFVVQSSDDDTLLPYVFDTLAKSANRQLSKGRAGLFFVGLNGIRSDSLVAVAEQDLDPNQPPTTLRRYVSDFLSGQSRDHVVGVSFISQTGWQSDKAGHVGSGGSAYVFPKKESLFWHDDFAGLFNN